MKDKTNDMDLCKDCNRERFMHKIVEFYDLNDCDGFKEKTNNPMESGARINDVGRTNSHGGEGNHDTETLNDGVESVTNLWKLKEEYRDIGTNAFASRHIGLIESCKAIKKDIKGIIVPLDSDYFCNNDTEDLEGFKIWFSKNLLDKLNEYLETGIK